MDIYDDFLLLDAPTHILFSINLVMMGELRFGQQFTADDARIFGSARYEGNDIRMYVKVFFL